MKFGMLNSRFDGAQDFDFVLRATEKSNKVVHISKILYHWRVHRDSTANVADAKPYAYEAGLKVVEEHLKRIGREGNVFYGQDVPGIYGIEYKVIGEPKVSILIPNKDNIKLLKTCVESILNLTTYKNYEIVIIENNSVEKETFEYYEKLKNNKKIRILNYTEYLKNKIENGVKEKNKCDVDSNNEIKNKIKYKENRYNNNELEFENREADNLKEIVGDTQKLNKQLEESNIENDIDNNINNNLYEFNYSALINYGTKNTDGDFILQLNNDTKLLTKNWLELFIGYAQNDDIGAVGARLYYEDKAIQHAGIAYGIGGTAGNLLVNLPYGERAYFGRESATRNVSAVTGACLFARREIYEVVGFMDEKLFKVAFNDVDFCLKIIENGYRIVYNPYVELIHYESKTRGYEYSKKQEERFKKESNNFKEKWKNVLKAPDPYYNPNFSRETCNFDLNLFGDTSQKQEFFL